MWPIEVIKVVNDPKKHAKTEKQKESVERFRSRIGAEVKTVIPTGIVREGKVL